MGILSKIIASASHIHDISFQNLVMEQATSAEKLSANIRNKLSLTMFIVFVGNKKQLF